MKPHRASGGRGAGRVWEIKALCWPEDLADNVAWCLQGSDHLTFFTNLCPLFLMPLLLSRETKASEGTSFPYKPTASISSTSAPVTTEECPSSCLQPTPSPVSSSLSPPAFSGTCCTLIMSFLLSMLSTGTPTRQLNAFPHFLLFS